MAEKLTPEKIEEAARHYENITSGKTPILKSEKETKIMVQMELNPMIIIILFIIQHHQKIAKF